jgi:hypothetical protein
MLGKIKKILTDTFVGDPVRDWGVVYEQPGAFFTEQIKLGLYLKDRQLNLLMTTVHKSRFSYNSYSLVIPVFDLQSFVDTLQARYEELCRLERRPRAAVAIQSRDKLPFIHRMILKLIHGIRVSRLLLDLRNPRTRTTEYRFYGYITRNSERKVFLQSDMDISKSNGYVISGNGFAAVLQQLAEYGEQQASPKLAAAASH